MFASYLFNTVTNHTAVATNLFKNVHNRKIRTPRLDCVHLKSVYCDYGFPTKQKLHIKSWISRLSKKAQTDRSHKELGRSFFFFCFYTANPSKVSSAP